jgi:hypothetical protein
LVEAADATGRGPDIRNAGSVDEADRAAVSLPAGGDAARASDERPPPCVPSAKADLKPACDAFAKPRGAGVPAAVSDGGGVGLPDLPRDARALGAAAFCFAAGLAALAERDVVGDFGVLPIAALYGARSTKRQPGDAEGSNRQRTRPRKEWLNL